MHHIHEVKIRGYHCDVFGHVNHARYLELLEAARWAMFEEGMGEAALIKADQPLVVVNANVNFRKPTFVNQTLVIKTSTKSIGRTSAVVHHQVTIKDTDQVALDADITFVAVNAATNQPTAIEGQLRDFLESAA